MNLHSLWQEKKYLSRKVEKLEVLLREPNHSHDFYDDLTKELSTCREELTSINDVFNQHEWRRDLHRLISEFKDFTKNDKDLVRVLNVLMHRLHYKQRNSLIWKWASIHEKENQKRQEEKKQERFLLNQEKIRKKDLKRIQKLKEQYPQYSHMFKDELLAAVKKEKREVNDTRKRLMAEMTKEATEESIKYWREKWGITKESLEEDKNE